MKTKQLLRQHIQPLIDAGATQKNIAGAIGFDNPNYLSMLVSDKYETTLLSLNRLERLSKVCELNGKQTIIFALARVSDAKDRPVEMNSSTMRYLLTTFAKIAIKKSKSDKGVY